jgi:hypothetical protein
MYLFHRGFPFPIFRSLGALSLTILASVTALRADVTIYERDQQGGDVPPDLVLRKLGCFLLLLFIWAAFGRSQPVGGRTGELFFIDLLEQKLKTTVSSPIDYLD